MLSAMNLYRSFIGQRAAKADEAGLGDEQDPWRILYEDEDGEDGDLGNQQSSVYMNVDENEYLQKLPETSAGESFQTVLLSEKPAQGEEVRRLSALNGSDEDIVISYYPFVIGKHKDLADYVLLKDTVSRFHIRLDEDNGNYTITDLNSTNGTRGQRPFAGGKRDNTAGSGRPDIYSGLRIYFWLAAQSGPVTYVLKNNCVSVAAEIANSRGGA